MLPEGHRQQLLRRVWLFSELDPADLSRIAALSRERTCPAGTVLVQQGDVSADLFAVVQGRLKVGSVAAEGDEILLSVMGPGDVFGELALLDDKPRSATVTATEACRMLVLSGTAFRPLLREVPDLTLKLLKIMAGHVRRLSARSEDVVALDVRGRLAKTLLDLSARFGISAPPRGTRISLRLSQQELGRLVGATREMVNKCLREWVRRRILTHQRGTIVLSNERALQALTELPVRRRRRAL